MARPCFNQSRTRPALSATAGCSGARRASLAHNAPASWRQYHDANDVQLAFPGIRITGNQQGDVQYRCCVHPVIDHRDQLAQRERPTARVLQQPVQVFLQPAVGLSGSLIRTAVTGDSITHLACVQRISHLYFTKGG